MDYIEELKKIRTELLESKNTHQKDPLYKILTYKSALNDFVNKEYQKFYADIIDTIPGVPICEREEEPIKVDERLKLRALVDLKSLPEVERKKLLFNAKRKEKKVADVSTYYWGHSTHNLSGITEIHYPIKEIKLGE